MKAVGIVAEFNPLHLGHNHILSRARAMVGIDGAVICAMSSCFVQRGEPAVFTKTARAEAAVRCGADLVIEIPCVWSLASAEGYAEAGAVLLAAAGADEMLFGSESGEISELINICDTLMTEKADILIGEKLQLGVSYARARQLALEELAGETAKLVESPNNILAIEYIKAVKRRNLPLKPVTFRREPGYSATKAREIIANKGSLTDCISPEALAVFSREMEMGRGPVTIEKLNDVLLSRLRLLTREDCRNLPGGGDGLGDRLYKAVNSQPDVKTVLDECKTKRYAMSRVKRTVLCACLGITPEDMAAKPPYIRVLAMNERGREYLHSIKKTAPLPIITKPAHVRELDESCQRVFDLEQRAVDLCAMSFENVSDRIPGGDFRTNPVII